MKENIIDNLKKMVEEKNYNEKDIVYFLVESYKLIEQNELSNFNLIKFYRNWTCHSTLSKDSEKIFEEIYILIKAREYLNLELNEKNNNEEFLAFGELIQEKVSESFNNYSFKKLKSEIDKFSLEFLDGQKIQWENFKENLKKIIIGTPLVIKRKKEIIFEFKIRAWGGKTLTGICMEISYPGGNITTGIKDDLFE